MKKQSALGAGIIHFSRIIVLGLLWAVAVVYLLQSGLQAMEDAETLASKRSPALAAENEAPCAVVEPAAGEDATAASTAEPARATLTLQENTSTTVTFGRGTDQLEREFDYTIADPDGILSGATCLQVEVSPFIRDTGDAQLERKRISAVATVSGDRALIVVNFDRTWAALGDPGSYAGVVRVLDPRVERTEVALQLTMSFPFWQLPLAISIFMLFPAIVYVWLLKGSFGDAGALSITKFQNFVISRNGILAIGAGTVAAVGVYSATYLSGPTWGSSSAQVLTLVGAAFAAFATASTAVAAAGADTTTSGGLTAEAIGKAVAGAIATHGPEAAGGVKTSDGAANAETGKANDKVKSAPTGSAGLEELHALTKKESTALDSTGNGKG